jgi:hypothetical protein
LPRISGPCLKSKFISLGERLMHIKKLLSLVPLTLLMLMLPVRNAMGQ